MKTSMTLFIVLILGFVLSGCARKPMDADNDLAASITACQNRMNHEAVARYSQLTDPKDVLLMSSIDGLVRGQAGFVDPCAQIKTHVHAEIAHAEFQGKIWEGFWSTATVGLIGTFTYLTFDSMFDTMATGLAAAGSNYNFDSGGGDMDISDSLNSYEFGGFGDFSDSPITLFGDNSNTVTTTDIIE